MVLFFTPKRLSSWGMAVILLLFSSTASCPSTNCSSLEKAVMTWVAFLVYLLLLQMILPSMATSPASLSSVCRAWSHWERHSENWMGAMTENTSSKVSWEGKFEELFEYIFMSFAKYLYTNVVVCITDDAKQGYEDAIF